jgi:hypothetical protein
VSEAEHAFGIKKAGAKQQRKIVTPLHSGYLVVRWLFTARPRCTEDKVIFFYSVLVCVFLCAFHIETEIGILTIVRQCGHLRRIFMADDVDISDTSSTLFEQIGQAILYPKTSSDCTHRCVFITWLQLNIFHSPLVNVSLYG